MAKKMRRHRRNRNAASSPPVAAAAAAAYAPPGNPGPHEAATRTRRAVGFPLGGYGPTGAILNDGAYLRDRARHAERNDPWAAASIDAIVSHLVGTGIAPHSMAVDSAIREGLTAAWRRHESEADADGATTFAGMLALAIRAYVVDGECFAQILHRATEETAGAVPLQLRLLEADHVPLSMTQPAAGGGRIIAGVEFDSRGDRIAYHVLPAHPGELFGLSTMSSVAEPRRIPASEIIHLRHVKRIGQVRGSSRLSSALMTLWGIHDYDDAERQRKTIEAMVTGFITVPDIGAPPSMAAGGTFGQGADGTVDVESMDVSFSPGRFPVLRPGEAVTFTDPAEAGGYSEYMRVQGHRTAAAMGTAYHQTTSDIADANYSSIRAGLLDLMRRCEMVQQQVIIPQFCQPYWRQFVRAAALAGVVDARAYARDPMAVEAVQWFPPGWRWVDPQKEQAAAVASVRAGFASPREIIAQRGRTIGDVYREIAEDRALAAQHGLDLESDPANAAAVNGALAMATGAPAAPEEMPAARRKVMK